MADLPNCKLFRQFSRVWPKSCKIYRHEKVTRIGELPDVSCWLRVLKKSDLAGFFVSVVSSSGHLVTASVRYRSGFAFQGYFLWFLGILSGRQVSRWRYGGEFCQPPQVLYGSGEMELVAGAC